MELEALAKQQRKALATATFAEAVTWIVAQYRAAPIDGTSYDQDGDMLLFQWGFNDGKPYLDLTRQAIPEIDEDDEDAEQEIMQLRCEFTFAGTMTGKGGNLDWCMDPKGLEAYVAGIRNHAWYVRFADAKPESVVIDCGNAE